MGEEMGTRELARIEHSEATVLWQMSCSCSREPSAAPKRQEKMRTRGAGLKWRTMTSIAAEHHTAILILTTSEL